MKLCYLIGYPVGHSMSAVMHNAAFKHLDISYEFKLKSVEPSSLPKFVSSELRTNQFGGASVTIPHKVEVMKYLDNINETAYQIGAVNTIVNDNSILSGYNTDGIGALKAITDILPKLSDKTAVVLGAGGAARSITYELSKVVDRLIILNRTPSNAEKLAEKIKQTSKASVEYGALDSIGDVIEGAEILVNTTPVGMHPNEIHTPVKPELIHSELLVFDIVYNPIKTRLLQDAEKAGATTLTGVSMLVYQGVEAFRLWTGLEPPEEVMFKAVLDALGGL